MVGRLIGRARIDFCREIINDGRELSYLGKVDLLFFRDRLNGTSRLSPDFPDDRPISSLRNRFFIRNYYSIKRRRKKERGRESEREKWGRNEIKSLAFSPFAVASSS